MMTPPSQQFAIVLASGEGRRFGSPITGKHLTSIRGFPAVVWALSTMCQPEALFSKIVVVTREFEQQATADAISKHVDLNENAITIVPGSTSRMGSFMCGLEELRVGGLVPADSRIMLVDANRPLFSRSQLEELLDESCVEQGACLARPVVNGVAEVSGESIVTVPDKESFVEFVTPEIGSLAAIEAAERTGGPLPRSIVECQLQFGRTPRIVAATDFNRKLTHPEDRQALEALAAARSTPSFA